MKTIIEQLLSAMKNRRYLSFLFFSFALNHFAIGQYVGGIGSGDISAATNAFYFNTGLITIPYLGVHGHGVDTGSAVFISFDNTNHEITYKGGHGCGDIKDTSGSTYFNPSVLNADINYKGGFGRGDSVNKTELVYFSSSPTLAYIGGKGRGDICNGTQLLCLNPGVLNLRLFIEGFYLGGGQMQSVLYNNFPLDYSSDDCDSITVELHASTAPYDVVASVKTLLLTNGSTIASFPFSLNIDAYYIAIRHRNSLETWSRDPLFCNCTLMHQDFTDNYTKAYDDFANTGFHAMKEMPDGKWAFYSGDIDPDHDGGVNLFDIPELSNELNDPFPFGYLLGDLDGDGGTTLFDIPFLSNNINLYSQLP